MAPGQRGSGRWSSQGSGWNSMVNDGPALKVAVDSSKREVAMPVAMFDAQLIVGNGKGRFSGERHETTWYADANG